MERRALSFWAVAQTVTNRESFAAGRIADAGFEVFAPKAKMRANGCWRIVALFPGYLFVRILDRWRIVTKTAGVLGLIMHGEQPARCPDAELDKIRSQIMGNGLVRLPKPLPKRRLERGQDVRIVAGPFCGFNAIYDGMSASDREFVLLDILGRKARVEVTPADSVVPLQLALQASAVY
jgi:transcriptional antiterminator RfaH